MLGRRKFYKNIKKKKKMKNIALKEKTYNNLIVNIGQILEQGRRQAIKVINQILVKTYWEIGKKIIEYERENKERAGYGTKLFEKIAKDLREKYGKGFS